MDSMKNEITKKATFILDNLSNYCITKYGEVINLKSNKVLKKTKTNSGYNVSLIRDDGSRTTAPVSRLVAMEYCPTDSFNHIVKHKDGNKYNNKLENLYWCISAKEKQQTFNNLTNTFCVYVHTCIINNKKYVGITSRVPELRWAHGHGYRQNAEFIKDIDKYGWDEGFLHEIIRDKLTEKEACDIEKEYIKKWNLQNPLFGYNISKGGLKTTLGYKYKDEVRKKLSDILKKRYENKENHPWLNRSHTEESKNKMKMHNRLNTPVVSVENNKEYISIREATRQVGLKSKNSILIALKDKEKTAAGYH